MSLPCAKGLHRSHSPISTHGSQSHIYLLPPINSHTSPNQTLPSLESLRLPTRGRGDLLACSIASPDATFVQPNDPYSTKRSVITTDLSPSPYELCSSRVTRGFSFPSPSSSSMVSIPAQHEKPKISSSEFFRVKKRYIPRARHVSKTRFWTREPISLICRNWSLIGL